MNIDGQTQSVFTRMFKKWQDKHICIWELMVFLPYKKLSRLVFRFFFFFNPFVYPCNSKYWHMSETVIKKTAPTITKWISEEFKAVGQVDSGQRHHSVCSVVLIPILFQCA